MRLWSLHPSLLDVKGLVALWREGLLAQKVIEGSTKGYRHHPQLKRFLIFKDKAIERIGSYLTPVVNAANNRNYKFDKSKIIFPWYETDRLTVTRGQLSYEFAHLLKKVQARDPKWYERIKDQVPYANPLFTVIDGNIEPWEILPE